MSGSSQNISLICASKTRAFHDVAQAIGPRVAMAINRLFISSPLCCRGEFGPDSMPVVGPEAAPRHAQQCLNLSAMLNRHATLYPVAQALRAECEKRSRGGETDRIDCLFECLHKHIKHHVYFCVNALF